MLQVSSHCTAMCIFLPEYCRIQGSIVECLSKAYKERFESNRKILDAIISSIILCGRQNYPIQAGTDEDSSFRAITNFRAETDTELKFH